MNKVLVVADRFRSQLSREPGGYDVLTTYVDGSQRLYTKIKNPYAYIRTSMRNDGNIIDMKVLGPSK